MMVEDGKKSPCLRAQMKHHEPIVMCVRERCGCEGGGKGLLIQNDVSGTVATTNDHFICLAVNDKAETLDASYYRGQGARSERERESSFACFAIGNGQKDNTKLNRKVGALNCMHDQQAILCVALDRAAYNQGKNAQFAPGIDDSGKAFTVIAKGPGGSVTVLTTLCSREVQHTKGEDGTKT